MTLLDERAGQVEAADLLIMAMVEAAVAANKFCIPESIHVLIGGLSVDEAARRLHRLAQLDLLEEQSNSPVSTYNVSPLGAELLDRELPGWSPSEREQRRRDSFLRSAAAGGFRTG